MTSAYHIHSRLERMHTMAHLFLKDLISPREFNHADKLQNEVFLQYKSGIWENE